MSAGCVRLVLSRTVRAICGGSSCSYWNPASTLTLRSNVISSSWSRSPFSTAVDDTEDTPALKKEKRDPKARDTLSSVGRKIPEREIMVIGETGENLGVMHRSDVIRLMDKQGLKLVLLNDRQEPSVYRLMSGKQIHEEQLKRREKEKAKAGPTQLKELSFTSAITAHDLSIKMKQVESWLEKKNHVKLTVRAGRRREAENLGTMLEQVVQQMEMMVGFVSKPQVIREGKAAMCVLRLPSAKELLQSKKKKAAASPSDDSSGKAAESEKSSVSNTDTTEESIQQSEASDGNKTVS